MPRKTKAEHRGTPPGVIATRKQAKTAGLPPARYREMKDEATVDSPTAMASARRKKTQALR